MQFFFSKKELYDAQLQINKLEASIKKLEAEKKELLKEKNDLSKENIELDRILDNIDLENYDIFKKYYSEFYQFYTLSGIDGVPAETTRFIVNCFCMNGLSLFSPFHYLMDEGYRRVIDVNANDLNRIFNEPRDITIGNEVVLAVEKFLTDKLKTKKSPTSTTAQRKQIEKLEMDLM